jgi:hypothetical protein
MQAPVHELVSVRRHHTGDLHAYRDRGVKTKFQRSGALRRSPQIFSANRLLRFSQRALSRCAGRMALPLYCFLMLVFHGLSKINPSSAAPV